MDVLLVISTSSLAKPLLRGLAAAGHKVEVAADVTAAEAALSAGQWDAVLASRAFDGGEAWSLTQRMRRAGRVTPVAAVGEQFSTADQVALLSAGLDQVFTVEPMWELVARLGALVRRSVQLRTPRRVDAGGIVVDEGRRVVVVDGVEIDLTPSEARVLALLAQRLGQIVSRAELIAAVAGAGVDFSANALGSVLKRLRKKLGSQRERLQSVRLKGYVLMVPDP
jgi:DNA-binding response OmpR family regulator